MMKRIINKVYIETKGESFLKKNLSQKALTRE